MYIINMKMVIIIRKDLNMGKGKMIAQASYATLKIFLDRAFANPEGHIIEIPVTSAMMHWMNGGYKKITVYVNSEKELLEVYDKAQEAGIPAALVRDHDLTEFYKEYAYTAAAIGPEAETLIDPITGHLPLL
jgi:PTH2 family peptidyl-tRNA hydrolase